MRNMREVAYDMTDNPIMWNSLVRYHNGRDYEYGVVTKIGEDYIFVRFFGNVHAKAVTDKQLEVG